MQLESKVAIVTGAGSGIGRAIALGLAAEGARVLVSDIDGGRAETVAAEIGSSASSAACDVSQPGQVEALVAVALDRFSAIDILVNNAGRAVRGFVASLPVEDWDSVFAVNVRGTFLCSRAVLPHMIERRSGHIVNTASGLGLRPAPGGSAYGASKAAVIHFTRSLALEVARYGITVNAFAPGVTDTPFWRANRSQEEIAEAYRQGLVGQAEDLVPTVVFLCSEAARDLSGAVIERGVFVKHEGAPS